jgi:hypothetical protein
MDRLERISVDVPPLKGKRAIISDDILNALVSAINGTVDAINGLIGALETANGGIARLGAESESLSQRQSELESSIMALAQSITIIQGGN